VRLYTIGFTKKSAEQFFELLRKSGAKRLVDVRLNNTSQLSGFAKKDDLAFFAKEVAGMEYVHLPELAPTQELLDAFRRDRNWAEYETAFLALLKERHVEDRLSQALIDQGCLLCSENRPHHCHRRLVADYLCERWGGGKVEHLV